MADTLEELHQFTQLLGIDPRLFHRTASYPHYDITLEMREKVIQHGAIQADRRTIISCGKKIKGMGLTASLFQQHGFQVLSENEFLHQLDQ